jgi:putative transposase
MRYRRAFVAGGSFFFTLVTERRRPLFASAEAVDVLREAFRSVRTKRPFELDAMVVLPDHLHCIWTLPPGDADFATRWRLIKTWFTKHCDPALRFAPSGIQMKRWEQALWQHRYWEHMLRDEMDYERHVEYIHYNPVKHGYVASPFEWPHSSFRRYVEAGIYEEGWGLGQMSFDNVGYE